MPVDPSLVDDVSWTVAGFEDDQVGPERSEWVFEAGGTVYSHGTWNGEWIETDQNEVRVTIFHPSGERDGFDVLFITPDRFIAVKGGSLYRYGVKGPWREER